MAALIVFAALFVWLLYGRTWAPPMERLADDLTDEALADWFARRDVMQQARTKDR